MLTAVAAAAVVLLTPLTSVAAGRTAPPAAVPTAAVAAPSAPLAPASAPLAAAVATNPITAENRHPGSTAWRIPWSGKTVADDTAQQVKGYASATSVLQGESIGLHVRATGASTFSYQVFRLGWYGGAGARLMQTGTAAASRQSPCPVDPETGEIACAWARSATVATTVAWTTGVYAVVLTSGSYQNYVFFTVRDDRKDALLALSPVNTYQAYNNFPADDRTGKSLYDYNSSGPATVSGSTSAVKVSFDRPYAMAGASYLFRDEAPFIRYAEARGFDLTYATDVDLHRAPGIAMDQHAVVLVSHSEYWSGEMYTAVEEARDAGVGLTSLGANNLYWQARYESSGDGTPNRVLVCYRRSSIDPEPNPARKTVQFRDAGRPEQALLGEMYGSPGGLVPGSHPWVVTAAGHWFYRGTGLGDGASIPLMVGNETDQRQAGYPLPDSDDLTVLARSATVDRYGDPAIAEATLYTARSGATVFDAGTLRYTRALGESRYVQPAAQAMTTNVLARDSGFSSTVTTARIGGANRYDTSARISAQSFAPGLAAVYLATGAGFPDALAATAATRGRAPILLVQRDSVPSVVAAELARLKPAEVRVVGGPAVVSDSVAAQAARTAGGRLVRIAGGDRYATAAMVSARSFASGAPVAYVATGSDFPDALAAGAAGAQLGGPVLLARPTGLDSATLAELKRLAPRRIVISGGTTVVSSGVAQTLAGIAPTVRRSGPDRYETSREVARDLHGAGAGALVALATGADFPDALSAGPLVAAQSGSLVLVKSALDPWAAEEIVRNDPARMRYIGGSGAISSAVVTGAASLFDSVDGVAAAPFTQPAPPVAPTAPAAPGTQDRRSATTDAPLVEEDWRDQLPWQDG